MLIKLYSLHKMLNFTITLIINLILYVSVSVVILEFI